MNENVVALLRRMRKELREELSGGGVVEEITRDALTRVHTVMLDAHEQITGTDA